MKLIGNLRNPLTCCCSATSTTTSSSPSPIITIKSRLSATMTDVFTVNNQSQEGQQQEDQDQDSLIDAAATHPHNSPPSPTPSLVNLHRVVAGRRRSSSSTVVGTIFGRRRGHVAFCVQSDPANPPPFLFELSVPTHLLAREMNSGLLRIALECHRAPPHHHHRHASSSSSTRQQRAPSHVWKAYCNGRKVGYAVRRKPSEREKKILQSVKTMTAGAGVLLAADVDDGDGGGGGKEGELMYMRARYERVVGSRDSVSYHLLNPGPGGGHRGSNPHQQQELSVFLLRT